MAALVLGYDSFTWNNGGMSELNGLNWSQLTPEQQEAATLLGETQQTWDSKEEPTIVGENDNNDDTSNKETLFSSSNYNNYSWDELPGDIQLAALILGYDSFTWNNGGEGDLDDLNWSQFTPERKEAAMMLGVTEDTWDSKEQEATTGANDNDDDDNNEFGDSNSATTEGYAVPPAAIPSWDEYAWSDLPEEIKIAFYALGYDENLWNSGGQSSVKYKYWDQLTDDEQVAASYLGYDENTWNNEFYQDGGSGSGGEILWDQFEWSALPEEIQYAASILGYDADMWDNNGESSIGDLTWEQLTETQKVAAVTLGYDENTWNKGDYLESYVETTTLWDQFYWSELPEEIKDAALVLGYDANTWDYNGETSTSDRPWRLLTETQQLAAITLGYNEDIWNNSGPEKDNVGTTTLWDGFEWFELPEEIQAAASVLGYDAETWDGETATSSLAWSELTGTQRQAATALGYNQYIWDSAEAEEDNNIEVEDWDEYEWSELPGDIQEAAVTLGYNQNIWDNDGEAFTEYRGWAQLTQEQQEAAIKLGYNQQKWDYTDADDYEYLFRVVNTNYWVSRYMLIYFFAAFCFVLVGIIDLIRENILFHIFMILAGLCGLAGAVLVDYQLLSSNILSCISVHFFLLESFAILKMRRDEYRNRKNGLPPANFSITYTLWTADTLFSIGALLDVILSYLYFIEESEWNTSIGIVAILAAIFWLICSAMYLYGTIRTGKSIYQ